MSSPSIAYQSIVLPAAEAGMEGVEGRDVRIDQWLARYDAEAEIYRRTQAELQRSFRVRFHPAVGVGISFAAFGALCVASIFISGKWMDNFPGSRSLMHFISPILLTIIMIASDKRYDFNNDDDPHLEFYARSVRQSIGHLLQQLWHRMFVRRRELQFGRIVLDGNDDHLLSMLTLALAGASQHVIILGRILANRHPSRLTGRQQS